MTVDARLPGGADAAIWAVVDAATRRLAEQTVETLRVREIAVDLAERYQRIDCPQLAGHLFEVMHKLSFNLDAIGKGATVRAVVTRCVGEPTAPADLRLVDGGRLLAEAQAKVMGRPTAAAHDLARSSYQRMQRLVPSDQVDAVGRVLDKRLTLNPEGVRYADFADARAHLTGTLHAGDVRSAPVSYGEAQQAAQDVRAWIDPLVTGARVRQIGTATVTGAAAGAIVGGLVEAGVQMARVRAGETSAAAAACTAAGAAARGAARSGVLAGLGETVRVAAAAGRLPGVFGGGTVPLAVASAVYGVAEAGVAFARGDVGAVEFAARSCESTLQAGLVWACGVVGQTVLPVPVVGALVGGLVGQVSATLVAQGLRFAIAAARADGADEARLGVLEAEARTAVATAALLGDAGRALGCSSDALVTSTVTPLLDDALDAVVDPDATFARVAELTRCFAGQPLFVTAEEFDDWMRDPLTTLVLDPNAPVG